MIERSLRNQPEHRRNWHVLTEDGGFETRKEAKRWFETMYSGNKYHYRTVLYLPKGKK
jgi:hypothetical protein